MSEHLASDTDGGASPAAEESVDEVSAAPATEQEAQRPGDGGNSRPAPDWWDDETGSAEADRA